jgi:hypothetical protein
MRCWAASLRDRPRRPEHLPTDDAGSPSSDGHRQRLHAQRAKRALPRINRRKCNSRKHRSNCGTQQCQGQPRLPLPLLHRNRDSHSRDSHDSRSPGSLRRALQQRRRLAVLELRPHRRDNRRHPDRHRPRRHLKHDDHHRAEEVGRSFGQATGAVPAQRRLVTTHSDSFETASGRLTGRRM